MSILNEAKQQEPKSATTSMRNVSAAGVSGSILEWYDFYTYGTAAALIFPAYFFPSVSPAVGVLASFATFALGFFARPVGGVLLAHYGDRVGRKGVLLFTIVVMGIATVLMGVLPSYAQVGIWAPILLIVLRLVQGFAAGAELGGASLLSAEQAPEGRRGYFASLPTIGVTGGLLLATAVFALVSLLPAAQFDSWGWRLPFLFGIVLVAIGFYVRTRVKESESFLAAKEKTATIKIPAIEVIRRQPKSFLIVLGATIAENGVFYILSVFLLSFMTNNFHFASNTSLLIIGVAAAVAMVTIPLFGALSDRVGRKPVYLGGAILSLVIAFPVFLLGSTGMSLLMGLAMVVGVAGGWAAMTSVKGSFYAELFPARTRFSGWSLGRELGSVLAGGLAPFIASALVLATGGQWWPVALYMVLLCIISIIAVALAPETYRRGLPE
jgi:MHS family shikimate/dehydroshikimate transporter-like MFS transporter